MIRRFVTWIAEKLWFSSGYRVVFEEDAPDMVRDRTLYLIGEQNNFWLAVMKCPCGCGGIVNLPMSANARPCWQISIQNGKPTLSPSIHRTTSCRSHFFLIAGRVIWCQ